jgi:hypothetical protein
MASYIFPYDNRDDYKGRIVFRVFEPEVPTISGGILSVARAADDVARQLRITEGIAAAQETREVTQDAGLRDIDLGGAEIFGVNSRDDRAIINSNNPKVTLYLPQAIQINESVEYDNVSLGALGGVAEGLVNRGANALGAIRGAANESFSAFTDLITGRTGAGDAVARLGAVRVAQNIPGQTAGNVAASTLRVAVNPNRRNLFRAVTLREFGFTFKMIANSSREAQEIENIVRFFRSEMYPGLIAGAEIVGYQFPKLFDIRLSYNNNAIPNAKINPCYLRNISTTYNPGSMGWHLDGKPSEVELTLTFAEERALSKQDI